MTDQHRFAHADHFDHDLYTRAAAMMRPLRLDPAFAWIVSKSFSAIPCIASRTAMQPSRTAAICSAWCRTAARERDMGTTKGEIHE